MESAFDKKGKFYNTSYSTSSHAHNIFEVAHSRLIISIVHIQVRKPFDLLYTCMSYLVETCFIQLFISVYCYYHRMVEPIYVVLICNRL